MTHDRKPSCAVLSLALLVGIATVVSLPFVVYRPDRPVAAIVPGSSPGPTFVVQIIRPRLSLPLGGAVSPRLFGLEAHLGFDSTSPGASIGAVDPGRLEFDADDWHLVLAFDPDGQVTPETQVIFELMLGERLRRVRCRPGDPATGNLRTASPAGPGELSGSFDIELAHCRNTESDKPLGWPSKPLILHGSFDRIALKVAQRVQAGPRPAM
ncbi:hypothetical protein N9971_00415 [bacterium]|nr:hypothetical protein [bacterium]